MSVGPKALGWSQDIGALPVLDGWKLLHADGRFRIELVREEVRPRLHLVPRFRQLPFRPGFGLGRPLWTDAPSVDVAEHVGVFPLSTPAGEPQLLLACEELRHRPLNPSRPLWEVWSLPGLPGGRVALYMASVLDGPGPSALGLRRERHQDGRGSVWRSHG